MKDDLGRENSLEGDKEFSNPKISGVTIDSQGPVISDVKFIPSVDKKRVVVEFNVDDDVSLKSCQLYLHFNSHNQGQDDHYFDAQVKSGKCHLEVPYPSLVGGVPSIILSAEDQVGNQTSSYPKIDFKGLTVDPSQISMKNLNIVQCQGGLVKIQFETEGGSGFKSGSVGVLSADSGRLSSAEVKCDEKGQCEAVLAIPKKLNTDKPQVLLSIEGNNSTDYLENLPQGSIDFSASKVDGKVCKTTPIETGVKKSSNKKNVKSAASPQ